MYVCPVCNGLTNMEKTCQVCSGQMVDRGRLIDYFDDYSPYLEDEDAKLVDGFLETKSNHLCVHVYHCLSCDSEVEVTIEEQNR
ncbi:hypothetical protein [Salinibacillus xinjiangensis]|uniref:Uncharacterized protein n=1 Tax=Salinibacillus xinjiangensis TaxID=1229268 RepID=A0A6G1X7G3_9BACI|nr:hypothetical protein [Salinibacillus xinjiangensis]MRG86904.1 hypothetical protein [Salinibacillus xinjiangensis]